MGPDLESFARALPGEQVLWAALLERVVEWSESTRREPPEVAFDAARWRRFLVENVARRLGEPPAEPMTVQDLDWVGIDDSLQEIIDSGYPWLGLSDSGLVGLLEPNGQPWLAVSDPADPGEGRSGVWRPSGDQR